MSKTTFPLILVFSSLSPDYNYCNHSCYQSKISVHTCQQLLCNKSELSYYTEQSCQMSAASVYTKLSEEPWLPPPLSCPCLHGASHPSFSKTCLVKTWWVEDSNSTPCTHAQAQRLRALQGQSQIAMYRCGMVHVGGGVPTCMHAPHTCTQAQPTALWLKHTLSIKLHSRTTHKIGQPGWGD